MKKKNISFTGSTGEQLAAVLNTPEDENKEVIGYCLFAHCFTCNKNLTIITNITRRLTERGFGVFRFDFTGLGQSEGNFSDTNFSTNVEDFLLAAEYMNSHFDPPCITIGHSLGGAAVLHASSEIKSVKAVATVGAPSDPIHVSNLFEDYVDDLKSDKEEVTLDIAGREITIKRQFLLDLETHNLKDHISDLGRPLLLFHSPVDKIVGVDNARKIYQAARHPKSFISLDEADHLVSKKKDARFVADMLATWAEYHIRE